MLDACYYTYLPPWDMMRCQDYYSVGAILLYDMKFRMYFQTRSI